MPRIFCTLAALFATAFMWFALGYGVSDAVSYLDWSVRDIAAGYSSAMQIPADPGLTRSVRPIDCRSAHGALRCLAVRAAAPRRLVRPDDSG